MESELDDVEIAAGGDVARRRLLNDNNGQQRKVSTKSNKCECMTQKNKPCQNSKSKQHDHACTKHIAKWDKMHPNITTDAINEENGGLDALEHVNEDETSE